MLPYLLAFPHRLASTFPLMCQLVYLSKRGACVAASLLFALLGGNGVLWASIYSPNSLTEDAATPAKVDGNAVFAWTARRGEPNDGTTQGDDGEELLGVAWLAGWLGG